MRVTEANGDPEIEKSLYSVASNTTSVRVQKAVDPEVAALLDDSDLSRFGSDVEDLEEDFVLQANNLHEDVDDDDDEEEEGEKKERVCNGASFGEGSMMNRNENNAHVSAHTTVAVDEVVHCAGEKPRARRLLDEQFDLVGFDYSYSILFTLCIMVP